MEKQNHYRKFQPRYRLNTCEGCRALRLPDNASAACVLKHPIDQETLSPIEPCEKPISHVAMREALLDRDL